MFIFVWQSRGDVSTLDRQLRLGMYDPDKLRTIWQQRIDYIALHPFWQGWIEIGRFHLPAPHDAWVIVRCKQMPTDKPLPPHINPTDARNLWDNINAVVDSGNWYDGSQWQAVKKMFPLTPALKV